MRISDWSSDVCSSDLHVGTRNLDAFDRVERRDLVPMVTDPQAARQRLFGIDRLRPVEHLRQQPGDEFLLVRGRRVIAAAAVVGFVSRSEEHTSALQSLMRISYAVF